MDNSFQEPSGRKYKKTETRETQQRVSNRRMVSTLLRRYENMVRRRFGEKVDQVDLKQLLVDCFHYDLNLVLEMNTPYTHLGNLISD